MPASKTSMLFQVINYRICNVRWWLWLVAAAALAYVVHAFTAEPELSLLQRIERTPPPLDLSEPASCL